MKNRNLREYNSLGVTESKRVAKAERDLVVLHLLSCQCWDRDGHDPGMKYSLDEAASTALGVDSLETFFFHSLWST